LQLTQKSVAAESRPNPL